MLMIIFGAGASYDSVDVEHSTNPAVRRDPHGSVRPPLATQLFEDRELFTKSIEKYAQCQPLIAEMRYELREPGRSLEQELDLRLEKSRGNPHLRRQLAALRFYLREIVSRSTRQWASFAGGATNYGVLLQRVEEWRRQENERVLLVTFNYDTLLEDAARYTIGLTATDLDAYTGREDYRLVKLHGSVNWGRPVAERSFAHDPPIVGAQQMIDNIDSLQITSDYVILNESNPLEDLVRPEGLGLFPAIAIPVETKTDFECPDQHLSALKEWLFDVDRVLLIGWRATERNFLALWLDTKPNLRHVYAVARGSAEATVPLEHLHETGLFKRFTETIPASHTGFSQWLADRDGLTFLRS